METQATQATQATRAAPPADRPPENLSYQLGRLDAQVEHVSTAFRELAPKLEEVRHQVTFVKGALWAIAGICALAGAIGSFVLDAKFTALMQAIQSLPKH